jgi:hypothetical protein
MQTRCVDTVPWRVAEPWLPAWDVIIVSIATKLIADLRAAAHRGRARSRPAAGLPAAPDERAPESHLSGLRASNTWCARASRSCSLHSIAGTAIVSPHLSALCTPSHADRTRCRPPGLLSNTRVPNTCAIECRLTHLRSFVAGVLIPAS